MIDAGGNADPVGSPIPSRRVRFGLRALVALLLLSLAVALVGPQRLAAQLRGTHPLWFGLAVLSGALANLVSAWRWARLAQALGLRAPFTPLVISYAQGITVNALLPGATAGGDMLRSIRLARLGNAVAPSALSVLLDRASGLWVLCVMSLLATAGVALSPGTAGGRAGAALLAITRDRGATPLVLYAIALLLVLGLPLLPWRTPAGSPPAAGKSSGLAVQLGEVRRSVSARRSALVRSLPASFLVQLLSAGALWLTARAAGAEVGFLAVLAVAAPIFIAAALPISLGGFGPREFAAGLAFSLIGAPAQAGVAAAILYGATAVVQGLVAAPLLVVAPQGEPPRP